MILQDRLQLYKEAYYFQLDFKEKLYARLNIILVLIIACITGLLATLTFLKNLGPCLSIWMNIIFFLALCCFILTLFFFYRLSHVKTDHLLPVPNDIETYRLTLIDHFKQYAINPTEEEETEYLETELQKFFVEKFSFTASENQINNEYRSKCINRIYFLTFALTVLVLLAGMICTSTQLSKGKIDESKYSTSSSSANNKSN